MAFSIFVDGSSNLPGKQLQELDIRILPCSYNLNGLDITSETKGIKLKLNSEENGEVEVTFDLKTTERNEKMTADMDLSNMQLK